MAIGIGPIERPRLLNRCAIKNPVAGGAGTWTGRCAGLPPTTLFLHRDSPCQEKCASERSTCGWQERAALKKSTPIAQSTFGGRGPTRRPRRPYTPTRYPTACFGSGKSGRTVTCLTNVTWPAGSSQKWAAVDTGVAVASGRRCLYRRVTRPVQMQHTLVLADVPALLAPPLGFLHGRSAAAGSLFLVSR